MKIIRYFGDYALLGEIAHGGMGVVYCARQTSLNRLVALKMIGSGQFATPAEVERFRQEAQAAANLDHPNIVPIYEIGEHEGQHYFSMKLIEGESLADQMANPSSALSFRDQATMLAKVAHAVHHAHQHGVIHRDLKPSNILLDEQGEPHLTDFGLAKLLEKGAGQTQSGAFLGTPAYMSPEQACGKTKEITVASDIYSLGAVLYTMLTGRAPFTGESLGDIIEQVKDSAPKRPRTLQPGVSADLEAICLKCLEKEPALRYPSAAAVAEDLERWLRGEPISPRRVSGWVRGLMWAKRKPVIAGLTAALLLVAATGLGGVAWQWREAVRAQHLAEAKTMAESKAKAETEEALARADQRIGEGLFEKGDDAYAVSFLVRLLRQHPTNETIASRLATALTEPSIALCLKECGGFRGLAIAASFSPDGKRFAVASTDSTAAVFDVESGRRLTTFTNHTESLLLGWLRSSLGLAKPRAPLRSSQPRESFRRCRRPVG